jgi:translation elongation factor EF-1beta
MPKKAIITVLLVPESKDVSDKQLEKDIKKSLECGWLAQVEEVKVEA